MFLRFTPTGQNIWEVTRQGVKIAEILLSWIGDCTLVPVDSHAFSLDEMQDITAFMSEAHKKDSAIVLSPALRPAVPPSKCIR
jgi:hypothetical protein